MNYSGKVLKAQKMFLDVETVAQLKEIAKIEQRSLSNLIRRILDQAVESWREENRRVA